MRERANREQTGGSKPGTDGTFLTFRLIPIKTMQRLLGSTCCCNRSSESPRLESVTRDFLCQEGSESASDPHAKSISGGCCQIRDVV